MTKNNQGQRLQKVIANAGYIARRKAELLITSGKVKVNDQVVTTLGTRVLPNDVIKINNKILEFNDYLYFIFYKPVNCLTTLNDPRNRPTIMPYFSKIKVRIYPVGRLDFDTSGLLLMTNDGDFSNQILHPKYKIDKVYQVTCQGLLSQEQIKQLTKGVQIEATIITAPAKVKVIKTDFETETTIINLTIHQGYKNQVKRMLKGVGSKVLTLKRIAIGNLNLTGLKPGDYRILTTKERQDLLSLVSQ
ncbi:pseudouridine synthase [Spiroplasma attinicola]|uniref:pseudouridine synthase n=1 Tax=Spiroplasma attinicola TaxID=2904537 RepID=UPI002022A6E6|nr:pseudouridine synthase [Spiroplasma sp. JKS002670]MCL8209852.1 Ribosomal large subunit pseudouridine synthase B [Spiroplasma sp. JKS002670]